MSDMTPDQSNDDALAFDISDEALEAAACTGNSAAYTQLGLCTFSPCTG